jgi:Domain of unknown function (DUF4351)
MTQAQFVEAVFAVASELEGGRMEDLLEKIIRESVEAESPAVLAFVERRAQRTTAAAMVLDQLRFQIGKLDRATMEQVRTLPLVTLKRLGKALLQFKTRADLDAWLRHAAARTVAKRPARRVVSVSNGGG